jgi:CheY-like chemotaxis protein
MENKKVLIIDDNNVIREIAKGYLREHNYGVFEAENGLEGVRIYKDNMEDIFFVLLDLEMPVMNGEQALSELVKINPEVKVVISTGCADQDKIDLIKRIKHVKILQKPYRPEHLMEIVSEIEKANKILVI